MWAELGFSFSSSKWVHLWMNPSLIQSEHRSLVRRSRNPGLGFCNVHLVDIVTPPPRVCVAGRTLHDASLDNDLEFSKQPYRAAWVSVCAKEWRIKAS